MTTPPPPRPVTLGRHWSFNLRHDPKRLGFVLARYRLAAEAARGAQAVLELGCSEGIGATMLLEHTQRYLGVDMDDQAIAAAKRNWAGERCAFVEDDFLGKHYGNFDAVVSLDVAEHIAREVEDEYFQTIVKNLTDQGVAVIGTPNQTAQAWASPMSQAGHINLFTAKRLKATMGRFFHNVFILGLNDELMHTGFAPMTHYLTCVGVGPRRETAHD